ncbi:MAG TPA: sulfatase-like hydrolase/transferase [Thermoleophilaceae bacterium]|nr:sulfatase-like hydrolase/transferase [Thermoleophilaceae bacterium]
MHLGVLSAFACAQALFDLLGRTPEFFATRGSGAGEIIVLGLALVLVPPALLIGIELIGGLIDRRVRWGLHLAFVSALVALLALQALKGLAEGGGLALVALALVLGAAGALAYARAPGLRSFLSVLAPAPAVFLVLFLLLSPASRLTLGGQSEARADPVAARAPVVMVVFDELPLVSLLDARGRIDARRLPSFAALASDATWFRNATTLSDQTTKAVPAILSGRRPRAGGSRSSVSGELPIVADYPNNLFTMLGHRYRHNVSEEVTTLCPEDLCGDTRRGGPLARTRSLASDLGLVYVHLLLPEALTERLPPVSDTWGDFGGAGGDAGGRGGERGARAEVKAATEGDRAERLDEFLAGVEGGPVPSLDFKHSMVPHAPWEYLPSGRRYRTGATEPVPGLVPASGTEPFHDDFLVEQAYQRHLLQVGYADRLLGRLLARLRDRGAYGRAAIVVVADHGVSFRRGLDRRGPVGRNAEDIASVPFLIKAPGQREARTDDAYVRTHEVLPTLAEVLGVRLPWRGDGRSGFSAAAGRRSSVEVLRRSGKPIVLAAREFERRRAAAVARQGALFGSGGSRLYGIGPNAELIGRTVSDLPVGGGDGARAQFKGRGRLLAYDPRSGFSPSHVVGQVRGSRPADGRESRELAVGVNGRIAAVAESYRSRDGEDEYFSALVPESALRPGRNAVELFEVTRAGGGRLSLASLGRA